MLVDKSCSHFLLFACLFVRSFVCSFVHSFAGSFVRSFVRLFVFCLFALRVVMVVSVLLTLGKGWWWWWWWWWWCGAFSVRGDVSVLLATYFTLFCLSGVWINSVKAKTIQHLFRKSQDSCAFEYIFTSLTLDRSLRHQIISYFSLSLSRNGVD